MGGFFDEVKAPMIPPPPIAPDPNKNADVSNAMNEAAKKQRKARGQAATLLTGQTGVDTSAATTATRTLNGF